MICKFEVVVVRNDDDCAQWPRLINTVHMICMYKLCGTTSPSVHGRTLAQK